MIDLTLAYSVFVILLAGWAWACAGCTGCGSCTEPTGGSPNSSLCTPDAKSGYSFCVWPAISGQGCSPGGSCQKFANQKFCLRWVSDSLWQTNRFTVDCTGTYGVSIDIQWQMSLASGGAVTLAALVYATGTGTLLATLVTYTGSINLTRCDQAFSLQYASDNGSCQNWPGCVIVTPLCCADCGFDAYGCTTSNCLKCFSLCPPVQRGKVDPPRATVHGIAAADSFCSGCNTEFNGSDISLVWQGGCDAFCCCFNQYLAFSSATWCPERPFTGWHLTLTTDGSSTYTISLVAVNALGSNLVASWVCPLSSFSCSPSAANTFTLSSQNGSCSFGTVGVSTVTQTWD